MKMTIYTKGLLSLLVLLAISCEKSATDYKKYLNGEEITFPGRISNARGFSGDGRAQLTWRPNTDPNVVKYRVFWNNNADSVTIAATSHNPRDTVKCIINNLPEYTYTFFVYSYDAAGNRSIVTEVNNVSVYGTVYKNGLVNRKLNGSMSQGYTILDANTVQLFLLRNSDTTNISTRVQYTNSSGGTSLVYVPRDSNSVILNNTKVGGTVSFLSTYIPGRTAIDSFTPPLADTVIRSIQYRSVPIDKGLFQYIRIPFDMDPWSGVTGNGSPVKLWNGSTTPQGWPNLARFKPSSTSGTAFPLNFAFDLGKVYASLTQVEEIGTTNDAPNYVNPTDFEIWGIADTANANIGVSANDPTWTDRATSKGWTLLSRFLRADNGISPVTATISNPPPVRFIIVKINRVFAGTNGAVNLSQLTFWNNQ
jgi:hypothetical protein